MQGPYKKSLGSRGFSLGCHAPVAVPHLLERRFELLAGGLRVRSCCFASLFCLFQGLPVVCAASSLAEASPELSLQGSCSIQIRCSFCENVKSPSFAAMSR